MLREFYTLLPGILFKNYKFLNCKKNKFFYLLKDFKYNFCKKVFYLFFFQKKIFIFYKFKQVI